VNPNDIPAHIITMAYNLPMSHPMQPLSGMGIATGLAHFWPAIETHIREQIASDLYALNPDRNADFSEGVDWAAGAVRDDRL
jgi:hypothetical protein